MQLVLETFQVAGGLQEVLGQDLLLLPGVGGHGDGVPDLNQDRLENGTKKTKNKTRLRRCRCVQGQRLDEGGDSEGVSDPNHAVILLFDRPGEPQKQQAEWDQSQGVGGGSGYSH